ncbi:MAG: hypothetical protein HOF80_00080, partial [Candidatus Thioglobus sp.]|nr:hypothetical protein [Candidatus Thioglobus sp.]
MDIDADLSHIATTDTIVVANNRQVLAFKHTFSKRHPLVQLPNILSWQQYLQYYWKSQHVHSTLRLIDTTEQRYLIESSLKQFEQSCHAQLINEVIKNYDYCANHLITLDILIQSKVQICEVFANWIKHYQQVKRNLNLIDINDIPALIL